MVGLRGVGRRGWLVSVMELLGEQGGGQNRTTRSGVGRRDEDERAAGFTTTDDGGGGSTDEWLGDWYKATGG